MKMVFAVTLLLGMAVAASSELPKNVQDFATWKVVATGLPSGGEHSGKNKAVYANPLASQAWQGKTALPVGSLVVKAPGNPKTAKWVAIMQKTAKGWAYQELYLRKGRYVPSEESQASCVSCHAGAKANDYLFSRK